MENIDFKRYLPYLGGVVIFLIISALYFKPSFEGKRLTQQDIKHFKGMSKEVVDWRKQTGEEALWTNSMFGGMPAYQISIRYPSNLIRKADALLRLGLPGPVNYVFLYMLGFFVLLLTLRVNPWLAVVGSIAFGFSSYFFIILEAGHNSKAHAIAYMAPVIAGVILTFRGKYLAGGALTALAFALELVANHLQITFYLGMALMVLVLFMSIELILQKSYKQLLKVAGVLGIAFLLAIGTNMSNLWCTYEYSQYTTRGKSDLKSTPQHNETDGLPRDYVTAWSYGVGESYTLMVPNFKGSKSASLAENEDAVKDIEPYYRQMMGNFTQYHGDQPFTSGPVYAGAIIVFLFLLGLFLLDGWLRWALLGITVMSIMLSWGKNFMPLTNIFLDYFPGYNKFRAVSMILVIAELSLPLLAILALQKVFKERQWLRQHTKKLWIAAGITGGLCLLMYLVPDLFTDFSAISDARIRESMQQQQVEPGQASMIIAAAESARMEMFRSDAIRSFMFIFLSAVLIFIWVRSKMKPALFITAMGALILIDMWGVDKRYVNNDKSKNGRYIHWESKAMREQVYSPNAADKSILEDKDPDYRVANLTTNPTQDGRTCYFHKSVGGYHGAKLKRFQELIDFHLQPEINNIIAAFNNRPTAEKLDSVFRMQYCFNMLNTRYYIYNPDAPGLKNRFAMGNAWPVNYIKWVASADEEIQSLGDTDPGKVAIINKKFKEQLGDFSPSGKDAAVQLSSYKPNELVYQFDAQGDQLVVFSEVYYEKGWDAYIDGNKAPYLQADYILRAMKVPSGKHEITFRFEPKSYQYGEMISLIMSVLLLLAVAGAVYLMIKKKKEDPDGSAPATDQEA